MRNVEANVETAREPIHFHTPLYVGEEKGATARQFCRGPGGGRYSRHFRIGVLREGYKTLTLSKGNKIEDGHPF